MTYNESEKCYYSANGYVFVKKDTQQQLGNKLTLGKKDSIDNYEEIIPVMEEDDDNS